jgi:hypothetical protein
MLLQVFTLIVSSGAVGAFISYGLQRRSGRVKEIPLIERVNRLVDPDLQGFVLARVVGVGENRRLEDVGRVREYQLTLRNTSTVHLHNVEVQFEFPIDDVEGWAERPVRSKTTPVPVSATANGPWKKAFRWQIPEFPSTDSLEFTFRAIDPPSGDYEVALYNSGQVVVKKFQGEPSTGQFLARSRFWAEVAFFCIACSVIFGASFVGGWVAWSHTGSKSTVIDWAGCSLDVRTDFLQVDINLFSQRGPWQLQASVLNTGSQKCYLQPASGAGNPIGVEPGRSEVMMDFYTNTKPRLLPRDILFGPDHPTNRATVMLYEGDVQ